MWKIDREVVSSVGDQGRGDFRYAKVEKRERQEGGDESTKEVKETKSLFPIEFQR